MCVCERDRDKFVHCAVETVAREYKAESIVTVLPTIDKSGFFPLKVPNNLEISQEWRSLEVLLFGLCGSTLYMTELSEVLVTVRVQVTSESFLPINVSSVEGLQQ